MIKALPTTYPILQTNVTGNKGIILFGLSRITCLSVVHGGRSSPAVACCTSDDWVAGSNPLRAMFHH